MYSVTDRIKQVKRPSRLIRVSDFTRIQYHDGKELAPNESIDGSLMGRVVDYMTRAAVSGDVRRAFHYCLEGAKYADVIKSRNGVKPHNLKAAELLLNQIRGGDDRSQLCVARLAAYDLWYRNPQAAMRYDIQDVYADTPTIWNIRRMVWRSMNFLKVCGGAIRFDFTFEPHGYTDTISSGDGDFLTADTLWDMKVLRSKPTTLNALQVLTYYVMGQHSGQEIYKGITKIGIYNPRQNVAYILDVQKVKPEVIYAVENDIVCYSA
ncbi:MAG: hypothetical protein IJP89_02640 [Synergistaceae bacterium]|nr:hypothetical protein [Synergistaceae bacterium]